MYWCIVISPTACWLRVDKPSIVVIFCDRHKKQNGDSTFDTGNFALACFPDENDSQL